MDKKLETKVVASEMTNYIIESALEKAYEDKQVPQEMRITVGELLSEIIKEATKTEMDIQKKRQKRMLWKCR